MEREKGVVIDEEEGAGDGGGGDDGRGGERRQHRQQQQQQEFLGVKLRRGISIGNRGGTCTPVPSWKVEEGPSAAVHGRDHPEKNHHRRNSTSNTAAGGGAVSARKLGANLWEIQEMLPISRMSRRGDARLHHLHHHQKDEKHIDLGDLSPSSHHDRPQSSRNLRRHVATSRIQHYKTVERNGQALQPVSPASYSSSMEVGTYNLAMTPTSSLDLKEKLGPSGYSLKTSTELLKVLNRIWSLEEQHASNKSLVKALKLELDHERARIQELIQEQQADRLEIDDLLKQVAEDNLVRKGKERERIRAAVQSIKDEVEDERRLRRHSESLHRKLAKELSEMKLLYSKALTDLERERKARGSLEDLCDEFAKGIGDYEQEVRELKQKSESDFGQRCDRLILHISEAWLDERLQMKLAEARGDFTEKNTIIDRLGCEVDSFLKARKTNKFGNGTTTQKDSREDQNLRRQSLESVHLNGAISAPQDAEDDDSITSDLHCFELDMGNDGGRHDYKTSSDKSAGNLEEARRYSTSKKKFGYCERMKVQGTCNMQVQFEEHKDRTISSNGNKMHLADRVPGIHAYRHTESVGDISLFEAEEDGQGINFKWDGSHIMHGSEIESSIKGQSDTSAGCEIHPDNDHGEESSGIHSWRGQSVTHGRDNLSSDFHSLSSPVQKWNHQRIPPDIEIAESSTKLPRGVKENTLKAKLLEARLEGQHARLRLSKG